MSSNYENEKKYPAAIYYKSIYLHQISLSFIHTKVKENFNDNIMVTNRSKFCEQFLI